MQTPLVQLQINLNRLNGKLLKMLCFKERNIYIFKLFWSLQSMSSQINIDYFNLKFKGLALIFHHHRTFHNFWVKLRYRYFLNHTNFPI